jgi:hypothetical protein
VEVVEKVVMEQLWCLAVVMVMVALNCVQMPDG